MNMGSLKKLMSYDSKQRFKVIGGYNLDKWIFQTCMLVCFTFLFFVAWHYDFKMNYYMCDQSIYPDSFGILDQEESCKNPFYEPATWENKEYLPPGEYGRKPGLLYKLLWPVTLGIFALGMLVNHMFHNKGFKNKGVDFDEEDNSEVFE